MRRLRPLLSSSGLFRGVGGRRFSINASGEKRKHYERRLLKFSPAHVYGVVSDTANYKEFVPWCKKSSVVTGEVDEGPSESGKGVKKRFKSELVVGFGMFEECYTSDVLVDPGLSVSATSQETNLLEYLHTQWEFTPTKSNPNQCWVNFKVEFQFKSRLYNEFAGIFMNEVVSKMVGAFEKQCAALEKRK